MLVDDAAAAVAACEANTAATGFADVARVRRARAATFVDGPAPPEAPFALVLLDPPYDTAPAELPAVLAGLAPARLAGRRRPGCGRDGPGRPRAGAPRRARRPVTTPLRRYAPYHPRSYPWFLRSDRVATALCPGSFDPVTLGHLDIIERTTRHFDEVIVAVIRNPQKSQSLFTLEERQEMLHEVTSHLDNIEIDFFKGLLVDFAKDKGAQAIVKGLRAVSDFDYELQMAQMNQRLSGIDTFFISTSPQHSFLSSSLVREVARFGGDVSSMVPPLVAKRLAERFGPGTG